jgi:hypothetical protein
MVKSYVISSPGRVGSTYLSSILRLTESAVISVHNPWFVCDYTTSCLILLKRRDIIGSIMSTLIAEYTNEYVKYSNRHMEKIYINADGINSKLYHTYIWHKWYWESHDLSRSWQRVERFYFEDFLDDYQWVYTTLGVTGVTDTPKKTEKCPYAANEIITNYNQCVDAVAEWESQSMEFHPVIPTHLISTGPSIIR